MIVAGFTVPSDTIHGVDRDAHQSDVEVKLFVFILAFCASWVHVNSVGARLNPVMPGKAVYR